MHVLCVLCTDLISVVLVWIPAATSAALLQEAVVGSTLTTSSLLKLSPKIWNVTTSVSVRATVLGNTVPLTEATLMTCRPQRQVARQARTDERKCVLVTPQN